MSRFAKTMLSTSWGNFWTGSMQAALMFRLWAIEWRIT
jgi:hypothetical protein